MSRKPWMPHLTCRTTTTRLRGYSEEVRATASGQARRCVTKRRPQDRSPACRRSSTRAAAEIDRYVLAPPEHLLCFGPGRGDRIGLTIAFYGSTIVRAGVDLGGLEAPLVGWRTGPGAPPKETTFEALSAEAAVKHVADHEAQEERD